MAINDRSPESAPRASRTLGISVPTAAVDLHRVRTLVAQARGTLLAASVAAGETGADDEPEWASVSAAVEVLTLAVAALGEEVGAAA